MSAAPQVDLEKISSVNWGKIAPSKLYFSDNDLEAKDIESTESIIILRKILLIVLAQLAGMTLVSLVCNFFGPFRLLLGNIIVLTLSFAAVVAFFAVMHYKPEMRKTAPMNTKYLWAGSISMKVFYGSLACIFPTTIVVTTMMAITCVMGGLYVGAMMAKSSTNREYLIRKLIMGAFLGFLVCIMLIFYVDVSF